jgi:exodeoxyribonuclease VII large subunit
MSQGVLSVSEVTRAIREILEGSFPRILVRGEVSNLSRPQSGHIYFSLLDPKVTDRFGQALLLPCAFFRGANQHLTFKLTNGLKVICLGEVTTYEGRGQYQLKVLRAVPQGKGELQLAFEQLKARLGAEGLFAEARKRPIPRWPSRIGIVTSPSGSVIHDMVSKLRGWFQVVILPAKVQGEGAAQEIAGAVDLANRLQIADVLIVGRGGGSIEDLWAFNEERVARAIAASKIPVISAVGHQDDWTIADYVADLRASTPTDAAKLLVHEQELFAEQAREQIKNLIDRMQQWLDDQGQQMDVLGHRLRLLHPMNQLERMYSRAQELQSQLTQSVRFSLDGAGRTLEGLAGRLQALSPLAVLGRGYSITFRLPDRAVVSDAQTLHAGDAIETLLAKGRVASRVTGTAPSTRWESDAADA